MAPYSVAHPRWSVLVAIATILIGASNFCESYAQTPDDGSSDKKPGVLLQAGISHSAFLPPLKLNEIGAVKDPAQALRKELGSTGQLDRATAYQKLLNLSAQKNKKPTPPALYAAQPARSDASKNRALKSKVESSKTESAQRFEVPDWLAGVWQRTQMTETKRTSLPGNKPQKTSGTSAAVVSDAFGTYRDKNGHIYQLFDAHAPAGQVDRGETIDIEHVFDYRLKVLDSKRVLVQAKAWHVQVGKFDKRLITAYQDEEFNIYTSLGPGKLRTDSSVKVFDKLGKPTLLTQSFSSEIRIRKP